MADPDEHGAPWMIHCQRLGKYLPEQCAECPAPGGEGKCQLWQAENDEPGEAPAKAPETPDPRQQDPAIIRHINLLRDVLELPLQHQAGASAILVLQIREEATRLCENTDRLWAEVQRLRPIAEAMKLVDQISDLQRQIAHLQAELARATGVAEITGRG